MDWIQNLTKVIQYVENHLTDDINIDEISSRAYSSSSHFQLVFHLVTASPVAVWPVPGWG